MRYTYFAAALSLVVLTAKSEATPIASYDFNTDQSSSFSVFNLAGDFVANFNYDHSTYVPQAGTTGPTPIPSAPNGTGTTALRLEANNNDATAAVDAVTVVPTAAAGLTNYILQFDLWMNHNGGAGGATGSTEFVFFGGNSAGTGLESPNSTASNAFMLSVTGEGGAGQDYRYYQGVGGAPVRDDALPNWNGNNEIDAGGAGWQALFPSPTYQTAGSPSKAWTTVEMMVNSGNVTVWMTPTGGTRTQVASFTPTTPLTSGSPFITYTDIFDSLAVPAEDNFALIDNIIVTPPPTAATDWAIYE